MYFVRSYSVNLTKRLVITNMLVQQQRDQGFLMFNGILLTAVLKGFKDFNIMNKVS